MALPGASFRKLSTLQQLLDDRGCVAALDAIDHQREWLEAAHIALTEIPAPTFLESARAQHLSEQFRELGLERVRIDTAGNLLGERPGTDSNFIALAAHLDTVSSPGSAIEVSRMNGRLLAPGISDNGAGLSALLAIARALQQSAIATDLSILFVGTVGEEGEGDLCGMRHLFSQREFCRRVKGVLVLDGASIHQTSVAGLGSRRFMVEVVGPGGHSWNDFGRVNPIHILADAVAQLSRIPLPAEPKTTLNIGAIHGGSAVNAIPGSAWMKVDIRSRNSAEIERLSAMLADALHAAEETETKRRSGKLEIKLKPIGERPAGELSPYARILGVIQEVDRHLGVKTRLEASSTDANIPLSMGIEAITIGGGGTGGDAHTPNEWYDPRGRELGLKRILLATLLLGGVLEASGV
jgi:acetylornithine deacetylase/succinyl-diaminopimelate desuccinylase-like protein